MNRFKLDFHWITAGLVVALLAISAATTHAATIIQDFEGSTPNSPTPPSGWSYLNTGIGTLGTYATTDSGGGSPPRYRSRREFDSW